MTIVELAAWATLVYIVAALSFHVYVALKVRSIYHVFQTAEGLQDFSDRIMRAWIFSAMTMPAQFFRMLGAMKDQAAEKAKQEATAMAAEAAQRVAVQVAGNGKG